MEKTRIKNIILKGKKKKKIVKKNFKYLGYW